MYERLLSTHQLVALQETKFSEEDSLQTNQHYIHVADSGARSFWSNTTSPVFNGKRGVVLVLSSASPFRDVVDRTEHVYKTQLRNRYLLLEAKLGDRQIFLHVVYAPVEPARRGEFFRSLPTRFDFGAAEDFEDGCGPMHLAVGDFNTTMDNFLDQTSPSLPQPGTGREELCDWLDALGLIDAWRYVNPETRELTSPLRVHRIDYCFLTVDLLQNHLAKVNHVKDRKWHKEDHVPVEFKLQATFLPKMKRAPWRCPT
ncbi:unnamed protein product [Phytophthora lilii]|uniref:Unnamed protein product n=1 Tax=Phytophthora lilii TaxID=2077276 RepID=A0A9W6XJ32_9STRA|nr:unnamed protein product [Phytophthora lilii]